MAGNLELDTLKQDVAAGAIDTVLVCFADMQGRLIGKRVTGHFFVDQVAEEMHACDYLLTVDMEMEPVPGYAAACSTARSARSTTWMRSLEKQCALQGLRKAERCVGGA